MSELTTAARCLQIVQERQMDPKVSKDDVLRELEEAIRDGEPEIEEQEARDLQERAFLVLLGDEANKKWPQTRDARRDYFRKLWLLAAESVEARP